MTQHQAPKLHHDTALWFFGIAALLTLFVSIPATFALLSPFHDGWWLALFAMLVFELGAVGAKLITIAIPKWRGRLTALTLALLILTTIGNALHGAELFSAAVLPPVLAQLRSDGHGPWLVAGSAALFPALLFIWLFAFTARIEQLVLPPVNPLVASLQAELMETRQQLTRALTPDVNVTVNTLTLPKEMLTPEVNVFDDRRSRVKALVDSGMTVKDAASTVGVSRQTASKYVKG